MAYRTYFESLVNPLHKIRRCLNVTESKAYHELLVAMIELEKFLCLQQPMPSNETEITTVVTDDGPVRLRVEDLSRWTQKVVDCRCAADELRKTCLLFDHPEQFVNNITGGTMTFKPDLISDWSKLAESIAEHLSVSEKTNVGGPADAPRLSLSAKEARVIAEGVEFNKEEMYRQIAELDAGLMARVTAAALEAKRDLDLDAEVMARVTAAALEGKYQLDLSFIDRSEEPFWKMFEVFYARAGYVLQQTPGESQRYLCWQKS